MPGAARSEIYFIAGMMVLILILCISVLIFFFKTYKKEMRERQERIKKKAAQSEP
jgi:F0F1-type ATP synthase membrane subunit b/b'